MTSRREDLPFTKVSNELLGDFLHRNGSGYLVEGKIDGEDLLIIKNAQGIHAINRYGTLYQVQDLPFLAEINCITGFIVRGEMYYPNGRVFDLRRALKQDPERIHCAVHDIIYFDGTDIRSKSLTERKTILELVNCRPAGRTMILTALGKATEAGDILQLYKRALEKGYEGVVVKPLDSIYKHNAWLKIKKEETKDVLLTGARKENFKNGVPWSWRMEMMMDGKQVYVGDVSSAEMSLDERRSVMRPVVREDRTFLYFDRPIVAEVRCQEILRTNGDIRFRSPVIVRVRSDKPPEECIMQVS